jgi:hypothetical protein
MTRANAPKTAEEVDRKRGDDTWDGGFIRYGKNGRPTYYIRRSVQGKRYEVSTAKHTDDDAKEELREFLRDPEGYVSGGGAEGEALYLRPDLIQRFLDWSEKPASEGGKGNSPKWRGRQKKLMEWWAANLADHRGRALDLRRVSRSRHIIPVLDGIKEDGKPPAEWKRPPTTDRRHKREVIKTFYRWLWAVEDLIKSSEDPVRDMPVGQGGRAQVDGGVDKVVPKNSIEVVIDHLLDQNSIYGHALIVQADTGWHITELCRFVQSGDIEAVPPHLEQEGAVAVLVGPLHKKKAPHRTKVNQRALASAKALVENALVWPQACQQAGCKNSHYARGLCTSHWEAWKAGELRVTPVRWRAMKRRSLSYANYVRAVKAACDQLGIPRFSPAWMRHTNLSLAVGVGHSFEEAGESVGHEDGTMARLHYAATATPPKLRTILDDVAPGVVGTNAKKQPREDLEAEVARLKAEVEKLKRKTSG